MAFQVVDQTYSGTYSRHFMTRAMFGMDTVRKGLVQTIAGIKKLHTIKKLEYTNPLRPNEANPVSTNTNNFIITGNTIVPASVDIFETYNPRSLEANDLAQVLSETIIDREVPQELQSQMVQLVLNRAGEGFEKMIWQGSVSYQGAVADTDPRYQLQFFDGFIKRWVSDASVVLIPSAATITSTTIIPVMDTMLTAATGVNSGALVTPEDSVLKMKYLMNPKTALIYQTALTTGTAYKGIDFSSGMIPDWKNFPVVRVAGIPDDTIAFVHADETEDSNLKLGMNSMSDWNLKIARLTASSEEFFIQGKMKWDVQYGFGSEVILYTTQVASNFTP